MIAPEPVLVEAARAGDTQAIARLLALCQPDVRRFARRACATREDADDAVQIALWQLHRRIGALRSVGALAGWLLRVVERACGGLWRISTRTEPLDEALHAQSASAPASELRLDISRILSELPAEYREVLLLRDVGEFTAPEVAQQLGLSVQAVKSRLHRARAAVRARLLAQGFTPGLRG